MSNLFCPEEEDSNIEKKCDNELDTIPAIDACALIDQKATNIYDVAKDTLEIGEDMASFGMTAIIRAIKAVASGDQKIINELGINIETDSILNQVSECNNIVTNAQTNVIQENEACLNLMIEAGWSKKEIANANSITNIEQINVNRAESDCAANQVLAALTNMDASIDNAALQEAVNRAKNLANSESSQINCNNINLNLSACKYLKQTQCCTNRVTSEQSNLIKAGCAGGISGVRQSNTSESISTCLLSAQSSVTDTVAAKITNRSGQSVDNTAEGIDPFSFFIILAVVFICFVGAPFLAAGSLGKKLFSILGILLIGGGIGCGIAYATSLKPEVLQYDEPFLYCKKTVDSGKAKRIQYKDLNNDAYGYDFFPDDIETDPKDLKQTDPGLVVYLSKVQRNGDECVELDTEEMRAVSHLNNWSDTFLLILACSLAGLGLLLMITGFLKKDNPKKEKTKLGKSKE